MKNFENDIKPNISPSPKTQSYPVTRIADQPELIEKAAAWFSEKWSIPIEEYLTSMQDSCQQTSISNSQTHFVATRYPLLKTTEAFLAVMQLFRSGTSYLMANVLLQEQASLKTTFMNELTSRQIFALYLLNQIIVGLVCRACYLTTFAKIWLIVAYTLSIF